MITSRRNQTPPSPRAFTLIELLIVVAIISILASIAVPNYLDAQTRAKVSRVKNDMRALSQALEAYHLDNNRYPYRRRPWFMCTDPRELSPYTVSLGGVLISDSLPKRFDPMTTTIIHLKIAQMSRLTTPVAYMTTLPLDVFDTFHSYPDNLIDYWDDKQTMWFINGNPLLGKPISAYEPYRVHNPEDVGYLLSSVGPDGFLGGGAFYHNGWITPASTLEFSMYYGAYDPTNGAISAGNIYMAPKMGGFDQTGITLFRKCFPEALRADWPLPIQ